jgi:pyruvate kinase
MNKSSWNRTKIVATLGPSISSYKKIKRLIVAGVDVARINLSHGTIKEHTEKIKIVRAVSQKIGRPIAVLADLPGPKLRVGHLSQPQELIKGKQILLTTKYTSKKEEILIRYSKLPAEVKRGSIIFLDDGAIKLRVLGKDRNSIKCKVLIGGLLRAEAGINVPGVTLKTDFLTPHDRMLISFSINQRVDMLALSFVRQAEDVKRVRNLLKRKGKNTFIISKIEKHEALKSLEEIIDLSDAIMVARGDLGVELPIEKVALIQKMIIKKCNRLGKPVITATQMLESMIHNPRPTRAEVTDISNAILDGTDAVMLSGETAIGRYPLEAVKTIVRIARNVEKSLDYSEILSQRHREAKDSVTDAMSFSACESALRLKAKVIAAPTRSGRTARMISRYRPKAMIVAPTSQKSVLMQLCLSWGVYPLFLQEMRDFERFILQIGTILKKMNLLRANERFILTGGSLRSGESHTNFVRVETVM